MVSEAWVPKPSFRSIVAEAEVYPIKDAMMVVVMVMVIVMVLVMVIRILISILALILILTCHGDRCDTDACVHSMVESEKEVRRLTD